MAKLIDKLLQLLGVASKSETPNLVRDSNDLPPMNKVLDDQVVSKLMQMIERTDEREYSCEETFALLDEYVDLAAKDEDVAALMPLVRRHIELCVDCEDEFQVLLHVLKPEPPAPAQ
jgi:hypothetical protein